MINLARSRGRLATLVRRGQSARARAAWAGAGSSRRLSLFLLHLLEPTCHCNFVHFPKNSLNLTR